MEEGVIVGWLKNEGDPIEPGDILAEVETDKATMELESYHEGILLHIGVKEGPVPVNGILAVIGEKGEDFEKLLAEAEDQTAEAHSSNGSDKPDPIPVESDFIPLPGSMNPEIINEPKGRIKASPLAKKMAQDVGIPLEHIQGTGEQGRIVKKDIETYLKSDKTVPQAKGQIAPKFEPSDETNDVIVSQMRKTIARRLSESKFGAPHFYITTEIDMDEAIKARIQINEDAPPKISFNDIIVKAAAIAIRKNPDINVSWLGDKIRYHGDIHIGVAVAIDDGLVVPVVKYSDQKSLSQINGEVKSLAEKARNRELQLDEMQGNTFTISNLGMFDVEEFTAIINPPDACILAVGSIMKKPVIKNEQIIPGNRMKVTLSCDHRVVDGATGAKFLQSFKSLLENPVKLLV
jgi:pyruvate dehydrogenase E2 component (dihydrolipoamide acetyltransferase)